MSEGAKRELDQGVRFVIICAEAEAEVQGVKESTGGLGRRQAPTFIAEKALWSQEHRLIAGIDEVGRGPLAGPVLAAAVILPVNWDAPWLSLVRDSKALSPQKRELLSRRIGEGAVGVGVGMVPPEVIDAQGIIAATRLAMGLAVAHLPCRPHFLLIDALCLPDLNLPQQGIIHGDCLSLSIAAASIVAKVERDRFMVELDSLYPGYGFARNKGYATLEHLLSLRSLGASPAHRRTFAPVQKVVSASVR